ncbi:MAG: PspC domain-containing protein [Firmicutes bacterium]|jgi:phage shock protein PspC (stress-responsive transcriptional regulator)|nr:PspC domain-containing protein [Bacillota bacterium]HOB34250.1 PspC domain-containing protein [Bacillota bacterium]HPZ89961.1 PspC domain-containing protein [Bacillota bacterium]HQE01367.1 PspC domain-containing protein [Bacillota bacterium]
MAAKRLYRSRTNVMISGVCGGLAEYFDIDPTLVRLGYVLLTLFTLFSGVIFYIIAALIIPLEN